MSDSQKANFELICSGDYFIDAISSAHRFITPPNTYIRYATEHKHDRLLYVAEGKVRFDMFNKKPISADKGCVIFVPYNIAYKTEWLGDIHGEIYSINYIMTDKNNFQITLAPEICNFSDCDSHILKTMFKECCFAFDSAEYGYILKCKYIFYKILYTLASCRIDTGKSKIGKAIRYITNNFLEETPIKELAEMCNLGECMFRRCFKQEMGISPVKYRNRLRIEKAYELLTVEARSVAEAMELTGFYDASYFNKTFKAYMGKSPSECKKGSRSI